MAAVTIWSDFGAPKIRYAPQHNKGYIWETYGTQWIQQLKCKSFSTKITKIKVAYTDHSYSTQDGSVFFFLKKKFFFFAIHQHESAMGVHVFLARVNRQEKEI